MADLKRRLEKLESVERAKEPTNRLKIETGYIQHLPAEFQGPRHLVVRDQLPWNGLGGCLYEWRRGSRGASSEGLRGSLGKYYAR